MKKYSVLLAIIALVLASLACQTIMGGGDSNFDLPDVPNVPAIATAGGVTIGGESEFPVTSDAFNVVTSSGVLSFQTKMSADDVMKFYRDELAKQGFTENEDMTTSFAGVIAMVFEGNGKTIVLGAVPAGDDSLSVNLAYQQ